MSLDQCISDVKVLNFAGKVKSSLSSKLKISEPQSHKMGRRRVFTSKHHYEDFQN